MKLTIVTGMSGAGKTQVVESLEDIGYYCIDNMPPNLISNFLDLNSQGKTSIEKIALVMDIRGGEFFPHLLAALQEIKERDMETRIFFLEASDETLIKRFGETRRSHPMTGRSVTLKDIARERLLLHEIRSMADNIIDTSRMKPGKLRSTILEIFSDGGESRTFMVNVMSFGFKNGFPVTAETVFDARFLPNPYYVQSLKKLTGNSKKVQNYVKKAPEFEKFFGSITKNIENIIPAYMKEGKYHLNVAFGCTGGQHRSVVLANAFEEYFRGKGMNTTLDHRDVIKSK